MPTYPLTKDWSDPIPVAKGDLVQNKTSFDIEVCAVTPPDGADAILVPPFAALPIESATTTVRARSTGSWPAVLTVGKGF